MKDTTARTIGLEIVSRPFPPYPHVLYSPHCSHPNGEKHWHNNSWRVQTMTREVVPINGVIRSYGFDSYHGDCILGLVRENPHLEIVICER